MLALAAVYCAVLPVIALAWFAPTPKAFAGAPKIAAISLLLAFLIFAFGTVRRLVWRAAIEAAVTATGLRLRSWASSAEVSWSDIRGLAIFPARVLRVGHGRPRLSPFQLRYYGGRLRWAVGGTAMALVVTSGQGRLGYWVLPHPAFVPEAAPLVEAIEAHLRERDTGG